MNLSVILPTYNEKQNIIELIKAIKKELLSKKITFECLIIDDDSPDGTYTSVKKNFQHDHWVKAILRLKDHSLARSILSGIQNASGENILVMDSDFNHDPKMIWQMYSLLSFYDLVIGSRFVYSGGMEDNLRNKFSFLYNFFVRAILGTHIQDNLSGFFICKKELLLPFSTKEIFTGYGEYFLRLLYRAKLRKYRILEIPVFYQLRHHGQSKSNFFIMLTKYTFVMFQELIFEVKKHRSLAIIFNR